MGDLLDDGIRPAGALCAPAELLLIPTNMLFVLAPGPNRLNDPLAVIPAVVVPKLASSFSLKPSLAARF